MKDAPDQEHPAHTTACTRGGGGGGGMGARASETLRAHAPAGSQRRPVPRESRPRLGREGRAEGSKWRRLPRGAGAGRPSRASMPASPAAMSVQGL